MLKFIGEPDLLQHPFESKFKIGAEEIEGHTNGERVTSYFNVLGVCILVYEESEVYYVTF